MNHDVGVTPQGVMLIHPAACCLLPCATHGQEMLEDDKLGTFDQLLMAQEEVVALQSQVRNVKGHVSATLRFNSIP